MVRLVLLVVFVMIGAALLARPAQAGGWALVKLDATPDAVRAGERVHLGFMVLQHGQTPIHSLGPNAPLKVYLEARRAESGEFVRADAVPDQPVGHFTVDVTFPMAGRWLWSITPEPFAGTSLGDLKVTPALGAADEAAVAPSQPARAASRDQSGAPRGVMAAVVVALAVLAGTGLLVWRRRSATS